jgi:hypothetical protein
MAGEGEWPKSVGDVLSAGDVNFLGDHLAVSHSGTVNVTSGTGWQSLSQWSGSVFVRDTSGTAILELNWAGNASVGSTNSTPSLGLLLDGSSGITGYPFQLRNDAVFDKCISINWTGSIAVGSYVASLGAFVPVTLTFNVNDVPDSSIGRSHCFLKATVRQGNLEP